jgi:hypothetical protein
VTPRLVSEAEAAAYVGLDVAAFRRVVAAGVLPAPLPDFGLFDLHAIDAAIDQLSAARPEQTETAPTDSATVDPRLDEVFLLSRELAARWGVTEARLANLRANAEGPPFVKLPSGSIRYPLSGVLAAEACNGGPPGFTWDRLRKALKSFAEIAPGRRERLILHLRRGMRES